MSTPPTVLIIGCGIAGPVLGNFYKRKGYHPIVFDKVPQLGDAGASLMLMSNGYVNTGLAATRLCFCPRTATDRLAASKCWIW